MIRVSVMYPKSEGATFDMDYYKTTHMDIVDRTMKPAKWEIDSGMDGPYIAIGHLFFESTRRNGRRARVRGRSNRRHPQLHQYRSCVPDLRSRRLSHVS